MILEARCCLSPAVVSLVVADYCHFEQNLFDYIFDLSIVCSLVEFVLSSVGVHCLLNVLTSEKAK